MKIYLLFTGQPNKYTLFWIESACKAGDPGSFPGSGRSAGKGIDYPLQYSWASPCGSAGKESACNAGDLGLIPGLGRSPGEEKGYPLQNSMDCIVHGISESDMTEQLLLSLFGSRYLSSSLCDCITIMYVSFSAYMLNIYIEKCL